jgi:hypothetical protein
MSKLWFVSSYVTCKCMQECMYKKTCLFVFSTDSGPIAHIPNKAYYTQNPLTYFNDLDDCGSVSANDGSVTINIDNSCVISIPDTYIVGMTCRYNDSPCAGINGQTLRGSQSGITFKNSSLRAPLKSGSAIHVSCFRIANRMRSIQRAVLNWYNKTAKIHRLEHEDNNPQTKFRK